MTTSTMRHHFGNGWPAICREPSGETAEPLVQRIAVPFEYPIYFTNDAFDPKNGTLLSAITRRDRPRRHKLLVVIDGGVALAWPMLERQIRAYVDHHRDHLELCEQTLIVPGGEACKNDPELIGWIHAVIDRHGIDRHSFVVAIGGGAVLDLVGYAAATAHRGVRLVRMPTTVLGQDDSGVGVKNGINAFGKKNFVGTFCPPFAVINDAAFLRTLSRRDLVAGMAEAVKVALVRDAIFFRWLVENRRALAEGSEPEVATLVRRSARAHLGHIASSGDPFELGSARPLDFGHWSAHKLEALTDYRVRHGEAVAIGIAVDTIYSHLVGRLDHAAVQQVSMLLAALDLPTWDEALDRRDAAGRRVILDGLKEFREHLGGELSVTLLADIGVGYEVHEIDEARMGEAFDRLRAG
jgi:3-dehydroquinate synthase